MKKLNLKEIDKWILKLDNKLKNIDEEKEKVLFNSYKNMREQFYLQRCELADKIGRRKD